MALLETQFRKRFEPRGEGYVFRQWGHDVLFTRAEVEEFVAERARLWSGWTFAIYVALGVVAPLLLWWRGTAAGAVTLGGVALLLLVVVLVHGERAAASAAQMRVPGDRDARSGARYTPEEYDAVVERARFPWRRPRFWIMLLAFAIAGTLLFLDHAFLYAAACGVLCVAGIVSGLIDTYRGAANVARRRATGEPEPLRPVDGSPWSDLWNAAFASFLAAVTFNGSDYLHARWGLVALALWYWAVLVAKFFTAARSDAA